MASKRQLSERAIDLGGVVFAVILAMVVNVLAARHYRRWDWTRDARYTLSAASLATVAELDGPVDIWLIAAAGDPEAAGVRQLLVAYRGASANVVVHPVDPDRDVLALEDLRRRFRVETGRTEDGRAVADAMVVVAKGDRHWFITPDDLIDVARKGSEDGREESGTNATDARAEPREEEAITIAIRQVIATRRAKLCFTKGHGEPHIDDAGPGGLAVLKDLLEKSNDEVTQVDTSDSAAHDPFSGCDVAVIAAPRSPFSAGEEARLRTFLLLGGNAFLALSPLPDPSAASATGMRSVHLNDAIAPFGIGLDEDLVVETNAKRTIPGWRGLTFTVDARPHDITSALVSSERHDAPRVVVGFARSLNHVAAATGSPVAALDLLSTSADAVALDRLPAGTDDPDAPLPIPPNALHEAKVVAMASERGKVSPSAPHGPRLVVVGSATMVDAANWSEPAQTHGAAFFVENALSWLAALPPVVDVPRKQAVSAGMNLADESRLEIRRYVLFYMPAAVALLGLAIGLRRRSTEGAPRTPDAKSLANAKPKTKRRGPKTETK